MRQFLTVLVIQVGGTRSWGACLLSFIKCWINWHDGEPPMVEMVERVARAIAFERDWNTLDEMSRAAFRDQARAAIETLRHRPTPNVIYAGAAALGSPGICLDGSSLSYRRTADRAWATMLDAALGESIRDPGWNYSSSGFTE
jgi:hypothetical protein